MPYSIPDDEYLKEALHRVIKRNKGISSLKKLKKLVIKELKIKNPDYTVSSERLRKIAVTAPFIDVTIESRRNDSIKDLKGRCPVCDGLLKKTKNETIFGGTVTLGYKCMRCPYWTTLQRRIPTRYRFEYDKEGNSHEDRLQERNKDK